MITESKYLPKPELPGLHVRVITWESDRLKRLTVGTWQGACIFQKSDLNEGLQSHIQRLSTPFVE
jgi:hypothetical protein